MSLSSGTRWRVTALVTITRIANENASTQKAGVESACLTVNSSSTTRGLACVRSPLAAVASSAGRVSPSGK